MDLAAFAIPRKCTIPEGAYGMLQIPEHNIMIPLYQGNQATAQKIVDAENSASIHRFGAGKVIADHALSKSDYAKGIWDVGEFHPDDVAFIVREKETLQYNCIFVARVYVNRSSYICNGASVYPKQADIMMVSCVNAKGTENYLAYFKYAGKLPT